MAQNDPLHSFSIMNIVDHHVPTNKVDNIVFAEWDGNKIHVVGSGGFGYRFWEAWVNPKHVTVVFDIDGYRNYIAWPSWYNIKAYPISPRKFNEYDDKRNKALLEGGDNHDKE